MLSCFFSYLHSDFVFVPFGSFSYYSFNFLRLPRNLKIVQHTSALLGSRLLCEATITQEMIAVAGSVLPAGLHACGLATAGRRAPWAACGRHGEARAKHLLLGEAARGCRGCGDPAASARTVRCSPARLACLRGAPRAAPRPSWSRRRLS